MVIRLAAWHTSGPSSKYPCWRLAHHHCAFTLAAAHPAHQNLSDRVAVAPGSVVTTPKANRCTKLLDAQP